MAETLDCVTCGACCFSRNPRYLVLLPEDAGRRLPQESLFQHEGRTYVDYSCGHCVHLRLGEGRAVCLQLQQVVDRYVSPALTSYLFRHRQSGTPQRSELDALTPAERQVLKLIAEYQTSKQIAAALFISPHTVQTHRKNICAKLELEGNHALMRFALEHKARL